ncbi:MAG: NUDIX hydrolase [Acidimicrobiales bacterium]|nr:NUDIX hydrolase [Acidimicrobiales bacterium]RZV45072.1 MAG: NUDIX hydrolase [Acidimicrobiales bacterium]
MSGFRSLGERTIHTGHIFRLVDAQFEAPNGSIFSRDVVRHPGAVAVVPVIDNHVVLVRQYRGALDATMLEIPAGLRDVEGEALAETAQRELIEETGMRAGSLEHLADVHNSIGFCDERITIFIGRDLEPCERPATDSPEEQHMEILRVPLHELSGMVTSGEITDAKTVVGVLGLLQRSS